MTACRDADRGNEVRKSAAFAPDGRPLLLVNLGCGYRFHPRWLNIDIQKSGDAVVAHDLRRGIPLPDGSADAVYQSHLLEHLSRCESEFILRECLRVLRPGGVVRVVVPDLEGICRVYLETVSACADSGDGASVLAHEWMVTELVDQLCRHASGGEMLAYFRTHIQDQLAFALGRTGSEGRRLLEAIAGTRAGPSRQALSPHQLLGKARRLARTIRESLLQLVLGPRDAEALAIGRFRLSGEAHRWMYDRVSVARLLCAVGFVSPTIQDAGLSGIPDFASYHLDTEPDGSTCKPDSLFVEATRPPVPCSIAGTR